MLSIPSNRVFGNAYQVRIDFLNYASLIQAIPVDWKQTINRNEIKLDQIENYWIDKICKKQKPNKYAYETLSANFRERPEKSENNTGDAEPLYLL